MSRVSTIPALASAAFLAAIATLAEAAAPAPPARVAARAALVTTPEAPVRVERRADGRLFVDFGTAMFGWLRLEFAAPPPPLELTVRLGEKAVDGEAVDPRPGGAVAFQEVRVAVAAGAESIKVVPTWKPLYRNWIPGPDELDEVAPFRYVEITGLPPELAEPRVVRMARHVPFDAAAAAFACSDPALIEVWELCRHSMKATSFLGLYVDGNRERIPYEADAYINQLSHYAVDAHYETGRLTLDHFFAHPTWPTEWRQHMPLMAWADWLASGDDALIRRRYDDLRASLLLDRRRPDGLFVGHVAGPVRDIVDWPKGEQDGHDMTVDVKAVTSAFHARGLEAMAAIARGIGRTADAEEFARLRKATAETLREKLFDEAAGRYRDGLDAKTGAVSPHASLHASMLPLAFGLVPDADVPRVAEFVASRGMACSVYGAQYLLDALFDAGRERDALALMTATGDRSWLHMSRDLGSTVTLEAWDAKFKPNLDWNHAWGAAPGNVIARKLMGIEPLEPGYRRVRIQPRLAGLAWAEIRQPTPAGPIVLAVRTGDGLWRATLTLPDAITAEVHVPATLTGPIRVTRTDAAGRDEAADHRGESRVVEVGGGVTTLSVTAAP